MAVVVFMLMAAAHTHTLAPTTAATATTLGECIASDGNRRDREHDSGECRREGLFGFRGHCRLLFSGEVIRSSMTGY
jgi:hypothetical protein